MLGPFLQAVGSLANYCKSARVLGEGDAISQLVDRMLHPPNAEECVASWQAVYERQSHRPLLVLLIRAVQQSDQPEVGND